MTHKESEQAQMSRKDREREQHRRDILDAAERVFVHKGFDEATIEEIAKQAEFSVGTLYTFFKGKDELYGCVIQRTAQDFMEKFEKNVLVKTDAEEAVAALIELRLTHFDEHREFFRLILATTPAGRVDPLRYLPPQCQELHDRYVAAVTKLFEQGIAQHTFDQADPLYLALVLEGIINAFFAYWSRYEPTEPLNVRIAKMRREFLGRVKVRLDNQQ